MVGLALILYEGGLQTSWRRLREVAVPAALLSTVGVVVSAVLTGVAAYLLFDLSWLESVLLGAVVSVDRRGRRLRDAALHAHPPPPRAHARGRVGRQRPDGDRAHARPDRLDRAARLLRNRRPARCSSSSRSGSASLVGVALGAVAIWVFGRLPHSIGAFAPVASLAAAALVVRRRGRDRRQRLPLGLPRRPRGRQHAVPLPPPARRLPRRARVRRAGRALHRPRPARLPVATCRTWRSPGLALACPADARRPAGVGAGHRPPSPTSPIATGSCSAGPASAARFRSCSRRSCSPRTCRRRRRSSTPSSSSSSSRRSCRGRRSSGSPGRLGLLAPAPPVHEAPLEVGPLSKLDLVDFAVAGDHAVNGSAVRELGLPRDCADRRDQPRRGDDPAARQHRRRRPATGSSS